MGHTRTTAERGYGAAHQRERRKWKTTVDRGLAVCCLCGRPITPGTPWHLDHTPDKTSYRGVAHQACNIGEAQRRKQAREAEPKRWIF